METTRLTARVPMVFGALMSTLALQAAWGAHGGGAAQAAPAGADGFVELDYAKLAQFHPKHGLHEPNAGVIQADDGLFYGVTEGSTRIPEAGGVYRMDASGNVTIVHEFQDTAGDPGHPVGELVQASDGNLYGLTERSLYRVGPHGGYVVLHVFDEQEGWNFAASPVQGADGLLYVVSPKGGPSRAGTLLTSTLDGSVRVLHAFEREGEGTHPASGLAPGDDGNFYGTTTQGGTMGRGTIYRISPDGKFQVLSSLDTHACRLPAWRLTWYEGHAYGMCRASRAPDGAVFRFDQRGVFEILHAFDEADSDGGTYPEGGVIVVPASGELYGTTYGGGTAELGTLFKMSVDGTGFEKLLDFHIPLSAHPLGAPFLSKDGDIYGASFMGGSRVWGGTVYRFHP